MIAVNYVAIFVAAICHMFLGGLWYSQILFGKKWMRLMNVNPSQEEMKKEAPKAFAFGFIGSLVMAFVLAQFVTYSGALTVTEGFMTSFWLWLGFIVTTSINSVLYEKKPFALFLINVSYQLVGLLIMGGILAVWH